ncbi:hypothetical protein [Thermosediminibacter litoriperuensis]|uniref:hypothetical protein n=1 Tax=Thermosediminibacter litoriperuensis TaxID=291989 RepID=UPI0011E61015|nr:hypothetical protein [Thermosediminibacter litoriperuensis]
MPAILLSVLITFLFLENFRTWEKTVKKINYRNKQVITAGGVVFVIVAILTNIYNAVIIKYHPISESLILAAAGMGFSGLLDDVYGSNAAKGLKGHFSELFRGRITTGSIKAVMGLAVAYLISLKKGGSLLEVVVNALIIALTANLLNLMDLRPGRACRFFLFSTAILFFYFLFVENTSLIAWFLPLVASAMVFLIYDSKEIVMMGDTGANVLGMSLGVEIAWGTSFNVRVSVLVLLIGIHLLAEHYSITRIIERISMIRKNFVMYEGEIYDKIKRGSSSRRPGREAGNTGTSRRSRRRKG